MRPRRIRRSRSVHDRQVFLIPQRLERRHRRMQPKEPVQIDHRVLRNPDVRAVLVVRRLPIRHHHIQPIRRAPLEDHHQLLAPRLRFRRLGHHAAREKRRDRRRPHHRHRPASHKGAPRHGRDHSLHPRLYRHRLHHRPMHRLIPRIVIHEFGSNRGSRSGQSNRNPRDRLQYELSPCAEVASVAQPRFIPGSRKREPSQPWPNNRAPHSRPLRAAPNSRAMRMELM